MLANLLQLITGRPALREEYDTGFISEVSVRQVRPRNRKVELLIWICWFLIAIKSVVVFWAVQHYKIPFSGWWIVGPTITFAALCTFVYWRHRR